MSKNIYTRALSFIDGRDLTFYISQIITDDAARKCAISAIGERLSKIFKKESDAAEKWKNQFTEAQLQKEKIPSRFSDDTKDVEFNKRELIVIGDAFIDLIGTKSFGIHSVGVVLRVAGVLGLGRYVEKFCKVGDIKEDVDLMLEEDDLIKSDGN